MKAAMPEKNRANDAGGGRLPSLDGLRAVSILLVILAHVDTMPDTPLPLARHWDIGAVGVDVFFAISGFLITTLLLREHVRTGTISLGGFYARRTLRILPPFLAYVGVLALLQQLGLVHLVPRDWIAALTYTVNFFDGISVPLGHLWSLSVEEHFYLVWPLVFLLCGIRRAGCIALVCLLVEPIIRWCCHRYAGNVIDIDYATFTRLDAIAAGCLLAIVAHRAGGALPSRALRWMERHPAAFFTVGVSMLLVSVLVLSHSGKYVSLARHGVNAIALCMIIWTTTRVPTMWCGRVLNWSPLAWLGRLSYSLYLWQQVFLDSGNSQRWMCRFPQNLLLALAAAIASHYLIERPLLRLRHRHSPAEPHGRPLPAAAFQPS